MNYAVVLSATLAISAPAFAQTSHDTHSANVQIAEAPSTEATGQIKSVDAKGGKVTIHHGPIAALGWPAMTMTFPATSEALKAAKAGQNVKFTLKLPDNQITAIQAQ